ncbi:MAG: hypothetical protein K2Q23_03235 [Bryobacteraceae bacterium]|nr:hypothetical protein [Bryobacteraceae bacterium]
MWSYLLLTESVLSKEDLIDVAEVDKKTELYPEMEQLGYPLSDPDSGVAVWLSLAHRDAELDALLESTSGKLGRKFRSAIEISVGRNAFLFSLEVARRLAAAWQTVACFDEESEGTRQACIDAGIDCCFFVEPKDRPAKRSTPSNS